MQKLSSIAARLIFRVIFLSTIWLQAHVHAQIVSIGNQTCVQNCAWFDYYTNSVLTDSQYEADGVTCYENMSGSPMTGLDGGGSGGTSTLDFTGRDISAKLECALHSYLHDDFKVGCG